MEAHINVNYQLPLNEVVFGKFGGNINDASASMALQKRDLKSPALCGASGRRVEPG